jgi:hypothetical protein
MSDEDDTGWETVFKDPLPKGGSYPAGATALADAMGGPPSALYFVATATWVRQAHPFEDSTEFPLIRVQRRRPGLRVRNEKVSASADSFERFVVVYAVPSSLRAGVKQPLLEALRQIREPEFILFCSVGGRLDDAPRALPRWI